MNNKQYYIFINKESPFECGVFTDGTGFPYTEKVIEGMLHTYHNGKVALGWVDDKDSAIEIYNREIEKIIEKHKKLAQDFENALLVVPNFSTEEENDDE